MRPKLLSVLDRSLSAVLPAATAQAQCQKKCWYEYQCMRTGYYRRQLCQFYTCEVTYGPWVKVNNACQ